MDENEIRKLIEEGNRFWDQNDFKSAISSFTKVIRSIDMTVKDKKYYNKLSKNVQSFLESAKINSLINRGLSMYNIDKIEAAIVDFNEALLLDNRNADALKGRAEAKYFKKDFDGAIDDYTRLLESNPNAVNFLYNRGMAFLQLKNYKLYRQAEEDFTQCIQIDSKFYHSYLRRGIARFLQQYYRGAIYDFNTFLEFIPNHPEASLFLKEAKRGLNHFNPI